MDSIELALQCKVRIAHRYCGAEQECIHSLYCGSIEIQIIKVNTVGEQVRSISASLLYDLEDFTNSHCYP